MYTTPTHYGDALEDRSRAQTTPNWPENVEDAFSMMVPSQTNPDSLSSIWPYDVKVENNQNRESEGSPESEQGSTII